MTQLPKNIFKDCSSLTSINLPDSILSIDDCAFYGCTNLQSAYISKDATFIGISAFANCSSMTSFSRFDTPNANEFDIVGSYAFANTGLSNVNLALRSSSIYTFWGDGCFQDCKNLSAVHFRAANFMSQNMFKDCKNLKDVDFNKNMMAYTYPGIYSGCSSLTNIVLPSQLLFLPENMFKDCESLTAIKFKDYAKSNSKLTLVQRNAFNGCKSLQQISFPETINDLSLCIEDAALSNIPNLNKVDLPGMEISSIGLGANFPKNMIWGKPYEVRTVEELKNVLALYSQMRSLASKYKLYIVFEFEAGYWEKYDDEIYGYYPNFTLNSTNVTDIAKKYIGMGYLDNEEVEVSNLAYFYVIFVHAICRIKTEYGDVRPFSEKLSSYIDECNIQYDDNNFEYSLYTYLRHINGVEEIKKPNIYFCDCYANNIDKYSYKLLYGKKDTRYVRQHIYPYEHFVTNNKYSSTTNAKAVLLQKKDVIESIGIRKIYRASLLIDVNQFIDFSDFLEKNQFYRGLSKNGSTAITISAKNGELQMQYDKNKEEPYVPPKEYVSDKTTTTNFKIANQIDADCAFYYNAKELYEWAKEKKTPCLFIYSLWGCGPCMDYQAYIWRNPEFQSWFKKQKFYLCGMEVESQYDSELAFCKEFLSIQAKNIALVASPSDNPPSSTPKNALGVNFKYYPAGASYASNLMTPVLVFMDKNGICFDYTYHNIQQEIEVLGIDRVIQCLKSLCLYHFDGNSLDNPQYVVDAGRVFNKDDYSLSIDYPWYDNYTKTIDLTFKDPSIVDVYSAYEDIYRQLIAANEEDETMKYNSKTNMYDIYLGGCSFLAIDYLQLTGIGYELEEVAVGYPASKYNTTIQNYVDQLNSIMNQYRYKIGGSYYKLKANSKNTTAPDTCGTLGTIYLFNVTFEKI